MKLERGVLGVLGGMGPAATILFMNKVLNAVDAEDDIDHIPMIVYDNTQVPSRIKALIEQTGEDPGPVLTDMAIKLEHMGADALVMPCNTAHNYARQIRNAVDIPFISMVEKTAEKISKIMPGGRVGILASPAVRLTALFEDEFRRAALTWQYPADDGPIVAAIKLLKKKSDDARALAILVDSAAALRASNCDIILIGCSEFSLLAGKLSAQFPTIDSIDVLVESAVSFSEVGIPKGVPVSSNDLNLKTQG